VAKNYRGGPIYAKPPERGVGTPFRIELRREME